jgi:hypothetical protein
MSNLNVEKEYYLNLPITYIDTVGKVENRLKINYSPSKTYNNMGDYSIGLQSKFTWLLETIPEKFNISYILNWGKILQNSEIKINIPYLDITMKAFLKTTNSPINNIDKFIFSEDNKLDEWVDIPFVKYSTNNNRGWKITTEYSSIYPFEGLKTEIDISGDNIILNNIPQNNKLLIMEAVLYPTVSFEQINTNEKGERITVKRNSKSCTIKETIEINTLNLETSIGEFPVISPNNSTVDSDFISSMWFQGKINGDKVKSFCINFYDEEYNLFKTSGWISGATNIDNKSDYFDNFGNKLGTIENTKEANQTSLGTITHYPNGEYLYNKDILECYLDLYTGEEFGKFYYNVSLSKYSIAEAWCNPYFTSKDFLVQVASPIQFSLMLNSTELKSSKTDKINSIGNSIIKFKGSYSQAENIPIDSYSFYLYDENENLINVKPEIFSENIFYDYDAFEYGKQYLLEVNIKNKNGQTYKNSYKLTNNYQLCKEINGDIYANSNIKNNGVAILLQDKFNVLENFVSTLEVLSNMENPINSSFNLVILRKEINSNISKNIFSSKITKEFLNNLKVSNLFLQNYFSNLDLPSNATFYGLVDYSAKNNQNYIYQIYITVELDEDIKNLDNGEIIMAKGTNILSFNIDNPANSVSIVTHWDDYILYPLMKSGNDFCLCLDDDNNAISWKFGLNCEENEIILNQDKTIFTTFSDKPKVIMGELNYHTGSLKCLLGDFIENNSYYEPNSLLNSWEQFLNSSSCGLFKNPKGDVFVVFIENNSSRSYMNEVANEYLFNNELSVKPTTISFNYIEIDNVKEKLYVQIGD